MTLHFPYLDEPLQGPPPPSLPGNAVSRRRPLVPVTIISQGGKSFSFGRALIDPGADDTIFPLDVAHRLRVPLFPSSGHAMRWRGTKYALRYGQVDLELVDRNGTTLRWPGVVAFTGAAVRYPLLGVCGCLEYLNVQLLGAEYRLEIQSSSSFPVRTTT